MILAILLASAIATTLKGRRAKSATSHGGALSLPFTRRKTDVAPQTSSERSVGLPIFDMPPSRNCRQPSHVLVALRLADDPSFELVDLTRQRLDLIGDFSQSQSSGFWQANVLL
ncbi:hypothetical protein, partial [Mesorhizobium sp.]|uniref:hypothetical protein n=1 Tax=Mesorhizobium sp. TaxID=1871066 RepID=UPI0025BE7634